MTITHTKRQQNELGAVLKMRKYGKPSLHPYRPNDPITCQVERFSGGHDCSCLQLDSKSQSPSILTAGCVEQSLTLSGYFLLEVVKGSTEVSLALFKTVADSFFCSPINHDVVCSTGYSFSRPSNHRSAVTKWVVFLQVFRLAMPSNVVGNSYLKSHDFPLQPFSTAHQPTCFQYRQTRRLHQIVFLALDQY